MDELRSAIQRLTAEAGEDTSLAGLMQRLCDVLSSHPEALGALKGRYRLQTSDTGLSFAFELDDHCFRFLAPDEASDVTIIGREKALLAIVRRELNPAAAMLTGKLKIKGSMQALNRFAQIL